MYKRQEQKRVERVLEDLLAEEKEQRFSVQNISCLLYTSILSVMSALLALVPFWYIWRIIHDILEVSPDFSRAEKVTSYGWSAVLFAVISIVVYIAALMCSHISAFRVAANIRKELMRHITALPIGVTEKYGSGTVSYTHLDVYKRQLHFKFQFDFICQTALKCLQRNIHIPFGIQRGTDCCKQMRMIRSDNMLIVQF